MGSRGGSVRDAILRRRAVFVSASLAALSSCGPAKPSPDAPAADSSAATSRPPSPPPPAASAGPRSGSPPSDAGAHDDAVASDASAAATGAPSADASAGVSALPVVVQVCLSIIQPPAVRFSRGELALTAESKATLDQIAKALQDHPHIRAEVQGHTDGHEPLYGRRLGEKRAEVARTYLIDRGVAADRLCLRGYGATRPIAPSHTAKQRAANRRVEFRVLEVDETCSR